MLGADPGAVKPAELIDREIVEVEAEGDELDFLVEVDRLQADGGAIGLAADSSEEAVEVGRPPGPVTHPKRRDGFRRAERCRSECLLSAEERRAPN